MNPDASCSCYNVALRNSQAVATYENKWSQVLFIRTEHLCGFRTIRAKGKTNKKPDFCFNSCWENVFVCECTWWDTFWELPELSHDIGSWRLDSRKM